MATDILLLIKQFRATGCSGPLRRQYLRAQWPQLPCLYDPGIKCFRYYVDYRFSAYNVLWNRYIDTYKVCSRLKVNTYYELGVCFSQQLRRRRLSLLNHTNRFLRNFLEVTTFKINSLNFSKSSVSQVFCTFINVTVVEPLQLVEVLFEKKEKNVKSSYLAEHKG